MPTYPILNNLTYDLPATDVAIAGGTVGDFTVLGTFVLGGTGTVPNTGLTVTQVGTDLRIKALTTFGSAAYSSYRITYNETSSNKKRVEFSITPAASVTLTQVDRYTRSYTYAGVPSAAYLTNDVRFEWRRSSWRGGSAQTVFATGPSFSYDFPDPDFIAVANLWVVDEVTGDEVAAVSGQTLLEEYRHTRGCTLRGNRNLEVRAATVGTSPFVTTLYLVQTFANGMKGVVPKTPGSLQLSFTAYKNPCAFEGPNGQIYFALNKWLLTGPSTSYPLQTELYRSDDHLRSSVLVTEIWDSNHRGAVTIGLYPFGACSVAIKTNTSPSQVWFKLARSIETWPSSGVYVGDLGSADKEPLSIIQRGDILEITSAALLRVWRSHDMGETWTQL
jgi:hypothetical protein